MLLLPEEKEKEREKVKGLFILELLHALGSNFHWIRFNIGTIEWNLRFRRILFQLVERSGTECVSTNHTCCRERKREREDKIRKRKRKKGRRRSFEQS